ncbi:MAG: sunset domain-containing protein, partial [Thermomicrobiales bacterium]
MSDADSAAWVVREGQDVLASDGKKVGEVTGSAGSALIVKHGFLFTARDLYVPASAIAAIDPQAVHLNVAYEVATSDEWRRIPAGAEVVPNVQPETAGAPAGAPAPADDDSWQIAEGMTVIGADGEHLGEVEDGTEEAIVVRVGRFFPKTITLAASQITGVSGNAVHVTATKDSLGKETPNSDTPLTDLQGRITNAWTGTRAELDPQAGAVDLGQPDPDLPIAPPAGDIPYTQPAPAPATPNLAEATPIRPEEGAGTPPVAAAAAFAFTSSAPASDDGASDAPDETIDSASIAAEVPGLDLTDAGIPAESEGGIVVTPEAEAAPDGASHQDLSEVAVASALSDAAAIGESPDPELAAEAAELAATEDYATGYTDLPSDPFEGDGDRPEDAEGLTIAPDNLDETDSESDVAVLPVDLPGDIATEEITEAAAEPPSDAPGFTPNEDVAFPNAPEETRAIPVAPAFSASTLSATAPQPDLPPAAPLPVSDTSAADVAPAASTATAAETTEKAGLFGQLRQRISSFFDKEDAPASEASAGSPAATERPIASAAAAGAAIAGAEAIAPHDTATSASAATPVDIDATAPDVEVGATIPDAPRDRGTTERAAAIGSAATSGEAHADDTERAGFLDEMRARIDGFLDKPDQATPEATGPAGNDLPEGDAVNTPVADLPDADLHAAQEPGTGTGKGFLQDVKERVDAFLDKPQDAQAPDTASTGDVPAGAVVSDEEAASIHAEDAPLASEPDATPAAEDILTDDELAAVYGEDAPLAVDVDPAFVAETENASGDLAWDATDEEPEEIAAEAYAQELYVSDPDIDGSVRSIEADQDADRPAGRDVEATPDAALPLAAASATAAAAWQDERREDRGTSDSELAPEVDEHASPDARTELAPDVEVPHEADENRAGFFESLRDKVEHFLDNPEAAEQSRPADADAGIAEVTGSGVEAGEASHLAATAERDDTPEPLAAWTDTEAASSADDAGSAQTESLPGDAAGFSAPADSTELQASRYAVVSGHDDDDDLFDSLQDEPGDETVTAPELFASDTEVQGASDAFEARADADQVADIDVEVDESAAVLIDPPAPSDTGDASGTDDSQGEQAESDLFAAVVDATADSDLDAFGTPAEHHVEAGATVEAISPEEASDTGDRDAAPAAASFSPTPDKDLLAELPPVEDAESDEPHADTSFAGMDETSAEGEPETASADDVPAAESAYIEAEEIEDAPDGPGDSGDLDLTDPDLDGAADSGDEAIAANAASGSLAGAADAAHDWIKGDEAAGTEATGLTPTPIEPTPFAGDTTVAKNAESGTLADADDAVARSTAQDSTIAGNALSGKLAGARDLARAWTAGEEASTASNAQAAIGGATPTVEGATPISASTPDAEDRDAGTSGPDQPPASAAVTDHGLAGTEGVDWIAAVAGGDAPNDWTVKGNANSGIYHTPDSPSYEETIAEYWFPDAEAAERAGYRAPRGAHHAGAAAVDAIADAAAAAGTGSSPDSGASGSGNDQAADRSPAESTSAHASSTGDVRTAHHGPIDTEGIDWAPAVLGEPAPNGWLVKGNADSGIYHTPDSPSYVRTIAEVWFPDAAAAERSGYRAPRTAHHAGEAAVDTASN